MSTHWKELFVLVSCTLALSARGWAQDTLTSLPSDSIYRLAVALKDQDGNALGLIPGRVRIISMIYTSCTYVCPMTVETIKTIDAQLAPDQRTQLHRLLLSLDPKRDTVPVLKKMMSQRQLDARRWTLARPHPGDVRKLAAVLGVQYRQLANQEFNHSSALILLDSQGRVRARQTQLGQASRDFVDAIRKVLLEEAKGNHS
jgi:protein SCO1